MKHNTERQQQLNMSNESDDEDLIASDEEATYVEGIKIPPPLRINRNTSTDRRLIITKIENNFFKSYPEHSIIGPFHKCFHAIVGPNGNGKSNVIDSLLFVFGYRSTKIRSKKLSVLIHKSNQYPNIQSCSVAVHFAEIIDQPGDKYTIVSDSEFVVSRTACKDGSSYYQLNGKKVQFKEVAMLLRKHGIDLDHNRFLILQGEVEQIAMMKPKADNDHECGLLEYLEDIIGTSRYKKPLSKLQDLIEMLSSQRTEKLNRVKLIENEMKEMEQPKEEAVHFLKTENTIVSSRNLLYQREIFELQGKLKSIEEEKKDIEIKQQEFMEKFEMIKREIEEKSEILKENSAKYELISKRKEDLKLTFNRADKKSIQLNEKMTQINNLRKKNKATIAAEQKKLTNLENLPEKHRETIKEIEVQIEELSKLKEKYDEERAKLVETFKEETAGLQEKKAEMQNDLVHLKKAADETKAAFALAESKLKIYTSREETEKTKLEELKQNLETTLTTIQDWSKQVDLLKKKIPATEKSLKDANDELNKLKQRDAKLVNEIRSKKSQLEENKSSMQASQSRGKVLDALMQQKREGNCPGLYGRLGDLGAIDKKYDIAISTACGPLDNIVVDTVNTAEWCIEFLKKYDLGRATFIALDKQEHLRDLANSSITTPENAPRLFDLIKIQDETVKTAFYYALRNTLVANDIDQATRIAYGAQRHRVVTLRGELIETTGTMSGGGKTVSKGRMGQSVRVSNADPREMGNLEKVVQEMEEEMINLRRQQHALESQINTLQPELRQMRMDFEKYNVELKELKQQAPQLQARVKEQEVTCKSVKANAAEVKKLENEVTKLRNSYEKAASDADEVQTKVNRINKEIQDKTSGKMKTIDKNIKENNKKLEKSKEEITRLDVEIKTADRDYQRTLNNIRSLEEDIEKKANELRKMAEERSEIEEDAKKLLKCIEEVSEQLTDVEKSYTDIKNDVKELKKQEDKLKLEKVDIDNDMKTFVSKEDKIKGAMHGLEVQVSKLQLRQIDRDAELPQLKKYTPEEIETTNFSEVEEQLHAAEEYIRVAKPNLNIIEQYNAARDMYLKRWEELDEITTKRNKIREELDKLRGRRRDEFFKGYNTIKLKLKEMYQTLTLDGDADFDLVDNYDPFSEGIQFNVRPPKKSWKKIANLSGGEKTLSSLALVFALHHYKPSPLYFMDEIDAALDFKNVSLVAHYIKERTKNAQFIIISLRPNMYELCNYMTGIYKIEDCTNSLTYNPNAFIENEEANDQVVPAATIEDNGESVSNAMNIDDDDDNVK